LLLAGLGFVTAVMSLWTIWDISAEIVSPFCGLILCLVLLVRFAGFLPLPELLYIIMTRCHALCFTVAFQEINDERVSSLKDQISLKDKPPVNHAKYRLKQAERVTIKK
jgi:hypothetical protein